MSFKIGPVTKKEGPILVERLRPTHNSPVGGATPRPVSSSPINKVDAMPSLASKVLVVLLIIASVVFIANMTLQLMGKNSTDFGSAKVGKNAYQAVFLTNGQVYFGKLDDVNSEYIKLTDIYYLQVTQTNEDGIQPADDQKQPQISLAKLGKELHGPEDVMYISRDQVLFWENLKDKENSQVTNAIEEFKTQESGQNQNE